MSRLLGRLGDLVERRRGTTVALWLAVTAAGVLGLTRLRIDPSVASLLPSDDDGVAALLAAEALDPGARDLIVVIRERSLVEDRSRFDAVLGELQALGEVSAVGSTPATFSRAPARDAPLWRISAAQFDALDARLGPAGRREAVGAARDVLRADPFMGAALVEADPLGLRDILDPTSAGPPGTRLDPEDDRVVLRDSGAALVRLTARRSPFDQAATEALVEGIRRVMGEARYDLVGGHAIAEEDAGRIRGDLVRSSASSAPLVLLFLVLSLRRFLLAHVIVLPVVVAAVGALGLGGLLLGPLPALGVASVAILVGLGVDFGLHVASRLEDGARDGRSTADALAGAGPPVLGGAATSIAAFLAFGATSIGGLARFGWMLAVGLALALLAALTLIPALHRGFRARGGAAPSPLLRFDDRRVHVPAALALVAVTAVALAGLWSRGLDFDASPTFMRPAEAEAPAAAERLAGELGMAPAALVVLSPAGAGWEALARAGSELIRGGEAALVSGASTASDDPERAEKVARFRSRHGDWVEAALEDFGSAGFRIDELRPALEQARDLLARDPEVAADTGVTHAGREWRRTLIHPAAPPRTRAEREHLRDRIAEAFPAGSLVLDPYGLGDLLGPALARGLGRSVAWALGAVALVVIFTARSLGHGAIALLPATVAMALTTGTMAWLHWPLHPGNMIALPLVLGLGVDDGLHLVMRYRERDAPGHPLGTTGRAIWLTTVTTVLGFGSLALASTPALRSLGVLVGVGAIAAFISTLAFVPLLVPRCSPR